MVLQGETESKYTPMKSIQFVIFAIAITAAMTTSAFASRVPDGASTAGLLSIAFAGLAGLRIWLKK